jgi:hypothetical protein
VVTLAPPNSKIKADSIPAIIHDRSDHGLGVFYFSSKPQPEKAKLKVGDGQIYELRWAMPLNKGAQYFGMRLMKEERACS